jgi:hypothetical protein
LIKLATSDMEELMEEYFSVHIREQNYKSYLLHCQQATASLFKSVGLGSWLPVTVKADGL